MRYDSKPLNNLISQLSKLPGIGGKSAQRLAFHILAMEEKDALSIADAIIEGKRSMKYCSICGNLTDVDPCVICSDNRRDRKIICIVESPRDVAAMERIREFKGLYH
ncbi:MAG: toprim domain-containing protein, partial [Eubacteriales bacterium]|nr:toprim domain-containing protein [Eubacteriales bacterium]